MSTAFLSYRTMRYTERVPLRLEKNTASHMDGALSDGETRADFIRTAIGHEIERRQPADADLTKYVKSIATRYGPYVNATAGLLSLLYDIDLLPEQLSHVLDVNPSAALSNSQRFMAVCELWKIAYPNEAAASPQPASVQMHDAMIRINDFISAEREAGRDVPLTDDGIRRMLVVAYPGIEI